MAEKVSIIITSYNQKKLLRKAIESVIAQSYRPLEIIICDDASSDGSQLLIKKYIEKYPFIKGIFQRNNVGVTKNRNSGFKIASGEYVSTLDGDDEYLADKIALEMKVVKEKKCSVVFSNVLKYSEEDKFLGLQFPTKYNFSDNIFHDLVNFTIVSPRDMLVKRECIEKINYQDETFDLYEDWDYALRLSMFYDFCYSQKPLIVHRYSSKGLSAINHIKHLEAVIAIIKNIIENERFFNSLNKKEKHNIFSTWYMFQAKKELLEGNKNKSLKFLYYSVRYNLFRSINYDTFIRLFLPSWLIKREARLYDSLQIGPLAIPFYLIRGIISKN